MKALIKSLEDAQKELNTRDPFGGVVKSLRQMAIASQEAKTAQEALLRAESEVEQAQQEVDNAENGTPEEQAAAQQKLADAVQRRAAAQVKLTQAENKGKKAQENLKSSLQGIADQLGNVKELFGVVSKLFRAGGDDETADAIDAISEGFSVMTTVIMGVVAAMILLEASQPWLLAIAAALSVIVGLVSFLSGNSNKKITKKVEESERAVKRLELAYIDLEHAVKQAFGMATIGANMAAKANKELQLLELKRQLALERSRDSKDRDEDKIIDLQKQIKELEYDIADTVDNIVNDLLGVSSVGDAMENMMNAFIEALRSGDDAMAKFNENVDEMIANMVKKMYVTKILQPWFEEQWNKIQSQLTERAGNIPDELAKIQSKTSIARSADTTDNNSLIEALRALGMSDEQIHLIQWYDEFGHINRRESNARLKAAYEKMLKEAEQKEAELQKELTAATTPTTDDMRQYAELLRSGQPIMEENMQEVANFLRELGLMKDDANKKLSNLQAGISGITEDTANALEAYMNGVSQQVYLQSDLLTQIRDAVVGFDIDVQTGTLSEMLLQLQNSYQTQQAIKQILEGWTTPSGSGIRVELMS
jgi:low affinity Fe/Cu permease